MNSSPYKIADCLFDKNGTIHVLLKNQIKDFFIPLYVPSEQGETLFESLSYGLSEETKITLSFLINSWAKFGLLLHSLLIDNENPDKNSSCNITLVNKTYDNKYIYNTFFIPSNIAFLISAYCQIPIFLTERVESSLRKISIENIEKYKEMIKKEIE